MQTTRLFQEIVLKKIIIMIFKIIRVLILTLVSSFGIDCAYLGRNCESPGPDYVFSDLIQYEGK